MPTTAYGSDLAYIHDAGFGRFATNAATVLLNLLTKQGVTGGQIIDLGCGSGILAEAVANASYSVRGYDISEAMVALARQRVPSGEFFARSFLDVEFVPCVAVTAIGEVFNYLFDANNKPARLSPLFRRIYQALQPGGTFLFDVATPGRVPGGKTRGHASGLDWACLFEAEEDSRCKLLTRRITSFRQVGDLYRRDEETHRLRLYEPADLAYKLRAVGFRVRFRRNYGELRFPAGYAALMATK
jgi:SAM-dependent methyltransferase